MTILRARLDRHLRRQGIEGQPIEPYPRHSVQGRKPEYAVTATPCCRLENACAFARKQPVRAIELKPVRSRPPATRHLIEFRLRDSKNSTERTKPEVARTVVEHCGQSGIRETSGGGYALKLSV